MKKNTLSGPKLIEMQEVAIQAARAAGKILTQYFQGKLKISEKPGAGLVTNADIEAQNQIVKILRRKYPLFGFLTEEAQPEEAKSPGRWIIDPLDGTTNFVHGFPMFCVSIAAEWNDEIVVGVIYHPILKDLYVAARGRGTTLNGRKIRVSKTQTIQESLLTTGFAYRKDEFLRSEMNAFEKLSGKCRAIRRPGSAALDLAYTARGVFDGFWERKLSPWDVAAGALLVIEAGGQVTDFKGNPFRADAGELLASNSHLHLPLLKEVST